jgi:hypothetical protein
LICRAVRVGRGPEEVLLDGFYWSLRSEAVQVGRVRVFEELLTSFNCSVLSFGVAIKFHREQNPRVRYNTVNQHKLTSLNVS